VNSPTSGNCLTIFSMALGNMCLATHVLDV
jgi:hypothetical protein